MENVLGYLEFLCLHTRFPIRTWGFLRLGVTALKAPFEQRRPRLDCAECSEVAFDTRPNLAHIGSEHEKQVYKCSFISHNVYYSIHRGPLFFISFCIHLQTIPSMAENGGKWTFGADLAMLEFHGRSEPPLSRNFVAPSLD